jgi:hypothetical protein
MSKFLIKISNKKKKIYKNKIPYCIGEIQIDDFKEKLWIRLGFWKKKNYEKQWMKGLERIKLFNKSCLIVYAGYFRKKPLIEWWVLYKKENKVFIQNEWLTDINFEKFNKDTCYSYIKPREIYSSTGHKVDEWSVDLKDIVNFLEEIKK